MRCFQLNMFLWLSMGLRQMAASQWPGLTTEGLAWFVDLTQPSVMYGSWVCPYGVAGVGMPFALLVLYLKTVQQSPLGRSCHGTVTLADTSCPLLHARLLMAASGGALCMDHPVLGQPAWPTRELHQCSLLHC